MEAILLVIHILLALFLIGLVLLQRGKGAEVGAAFGRGASATVFGARGSASFLTKLTAIGAVLFFGTSLSLAYISSHKEQSGSSLFDQMHTTDSSAQLLSPDAGQQQAKVATKASSEVTDADVPPVEEVDSGDVPPIEE